MRSVAKGEDRVMHDSSTSEKKKAIRDWWADAPMTYAEDHGHVEYRLPDGSLERV